MNNFEQVFFKKYISKGQIVKGTIHEHWIKIINPLFFWLTSGLLIPTFLYYYSKAIQELIPFWILEIFLFFIFLKIIYDIFNWYNDVWIITNEGIVDLDWALFKTDVKTVKYENIEGIEIEQNSIWDKILNKGNIIIHKIGEDVFLLEDAIIPYEAVNEIEKISKKVANEADEVEKQKFDVVMEALTGVVKTYLEKKIETKNNSYNENNDENKINYNKGTINLR